MMNCNHYSSAESRRDFLAKFSYGIGAMALGDLLSPRTEAAASSQAGRASVRGWTTASAA